jgi:hypothetical protein
MAIWYDPREEFLKDMIDGINKFKLGLGAWNNLLSYTTSKKLYYPQNLQDVIIFNKRFVKFFIKELVNKTLKTFGSQKTIFRYDDYGEYYYYRNLHDGFSTK